MPAAGHFAASKNPNPSPPTSATFFHPLRDQLQGYPFPAILPAPIPSTVDACPFTCELYVTKIGRAGGGGRVGAEGRRPVPQAAAGEARPDGPSRPGAAPACRVVRPIPPHPPGPAPRPSRLQAS